MFKLVVLAVFIVSSFIIIPPDAVVESMDVWGVMLVLLPPILLLLLPDDEDILVLLVVPDVVRVRLLVRPLDLLRRLELVVPDLVRLCDRVDRRPADRDRRLDDP